MEHDDVKGCCLATVCLDVFVLGLRGDMGTWFEFIGDDWLITKQKTFKSKTMRLMLQGYLAYIPVRLFTRGDTIG